MAIGNWYAHGGMNSLADYERYIGRNLKAVYARIIQAAAQAQRDPESIGLVAVSKTFPVHHIQAAYRAGQRIFGESYVQEAAQKIAALGKEPLDEPIEWHFIGPIQSNKSRGVAEHFDWIHSVDRLKIAHRLSEQRPSGRPPVQICLQVNVSAEASKSGAAPADVLALAKAVAVLPNLCLRGLMCVPQATQDVAAQRIQFACLRRLRDEIIANGIHLDTLSMGMTDDLEAAVLEGATLVRVGRAIFGDRT